MSDENRSRDEALLQKIHAELEKTNAQITRFGLPIFALLVILVVLEIVHR